MRLGGAPDGAQNAFQVFRDLAGRDAEHPEPAALHPAIAFDVTGVVVAGVEAAVDLDDEACLVAVEVGDVGAERALAAEAEAGELFAPEV